MKDAQYWLILSVKLKTKFMSPETRRHAGILIVIKPTAIYGGVSILGSLIHDPVYMQNPPFVKVLTRPTCQPPVKITIPEAAIFLPAAFFFSVRRPGDTTPNGLINLAYVGVASLATGLLTPGIGLIRKGKDKVKT